MHQFEVDSEDEDEENKRHDNYNRHRITVQVEVHDQPLFTELSNDDGHRDEIELVEFKAPPQQYMNGHKPSNLLSSFHKRHSQKGSNVRRQTSYSTEDRLDEAESNSQIDEVSIV